MIMSSHVIAQAAADHPRRVPATDGILDQAGIAGTEAPEGAVSEADLPPGV
jgi:hypothetical protein